MYTTFSTLNGKRSAALTLTRRHMIRGHTDNSLTGASFRNAERASALEGILPRRRTVITAQRS